MENTVAQGPHPTIGIVVIGRNEGDRLKRCLGSLSSYIPRTVYVDSGSTDGSIDFATQAGVQVVSLDTDTHFTAARARNTGFVHLHGMYPDLAFVQFVDGDCELADGWLQHAIAFLESHDEVAVVCGRLRERHPDRSVYNLLCDMEWDAPVGEASSCGGNCLVRTSVFRQVNGYKADLIAGEEPELCLRIRAAGWRIWRISSEMALHDAAMTQFRQWWIREMRTGYSFAQGVRLHGSSPSRYRIREWRRAWFWGVGLPLLILLAVFAWGPLCFGALGAYAFQTMRLARSGSRSSRENWLWAIFVVAGKFPEALGQLRFLTQYRSRRPRLIEYK